jgi:Spy/CpxP family protein refolding chaperone
MSSDVNKESLVMQRSKQQALAFLLGAVLVGGVLGFSAERVFGHAPDHSWGPREQMYDDLSLSLEQRKAMDSVLDESNHQRELVLKPVKPALDSIKAATRTQFYRIFTPEQRAKFQQRLAEDSVKREKTRQARESKNK